MDNQDITIIEGPLNEPRDEGRTAVATMFERMPIAGRGLNAGAVAIESERAIAEAQGKLIIAKRFPRSMAAATAKLSEACKNPDFAAAAFYTVPNRGSGPSIRFAEEVARVYGNFQYGHRELSRGDGKSEIEVYAWDMEENNHSVRQITVMHVVDTKNGPRVLRDQADIDNKIANVASKQMRGRILALVAKSLVSTGIAECKKTIAGNNTVSIATRVTRMTEAFSAFGVTAGMLAEYIKHPLDTVTVDELSDMMGVYNAIKEGAKPVDYFGTAPAAEKTDDEKAEAATNRAGLSAARAAAGKKTETKAPEAAPEAPVQETEAVAEAAAEPEAAEEPVLVEARTQAAAEDGSVF